MPILAAALIILVLTLLFACAVTDIRSRIIPNRLVIVIACLAAPYWFAAEPDSVDRIIGQAAILAMAGPALLLLFATQAWGGGDVKLSAALLLWLPERDAVEAALVMAVMGGILALVMLLFRRRTTDRSVPYGVAIAIAAAIPLTARLPSPF